MLLDAFLQLSKEQAPVSGFVVSTNTIDLSEARDIASGCTLFALFGVDETVTSGSASTVTFQVISSAAANLGSPTVIAQTGAIPKADLVAGRNPIGLPIPDHALLSLPKGQRYLGVQYTIGGANLTAGKFTASISKDAPSGAVKMYPSGFDVA